MRVKAAPDAAVTRLHASTRRPDIGGTVPYDSSLLRHCACCRNQHDGANYKNILPHSLSSSFCTPDMHGLTPGNQVGFCPTTYFPTTLCQWSRCQWRRCQWSLCRLRVACHAVRDVLRGVYHAARGVLRGALHAVPSRSSGPQHPTLSARVAGTARATAAVTPRRENAVRREISSDLIFSVIFKSPLSSLLFVPPRLALRDRETATNSAFESEAGVSSAANSVSSSGEGGERAPLVAPFTILCEDG